MSRLKNFCFTPHFFQKVNFTYLFKMQLLFNPYTYRSVFTYCCSSFLLYKFHNERDKDEPSSRFVALKQEKCGPGQPAMPAAALYVIIPAHYASPSLLLFLMPPSATQSILLMFIANPLCQVNVAQPKDQLFFCPCAQLPQGKPTQE